MDVNVRGGVPLPVFYKGRKIKDEGFRLDLLVENLIIVELKSVELVQSVHKKQLLTYLRLANKELGLLINFGEVVLKNGIHRIINSPKSVSAASVVSSEGSERARGKGLSQTVGTEENFCLSAGVDKQKDSVPRNGYSCPKIARCRQSGGI
jgi:GxxExxY protein